VRSPRHRLSGDKLPCHVIDVASQHSAPLLPYPLVNLASANNNPKSILGSFCFVGVVCGSTDIRSITYSHLVVWQREERNVLNASWRNPRKRRDEHTGTRVFYPCSGLLEASSPTSCMSAPIAR
jgi:hypothetical protein